MPPDLVGAPASAASTARVRSLPGAEQGAQQAEGCAHPRGGLQQAREAQVRRSLCPVAPGEPCDGAGEPGVAGQDDALRVVRRVVRVSFAMSLGVSPGLWRPRRPSARPGSVPASGRAADVPASIGRVRPSSAAATAAAAAAAAPEPPTRRTT